MKRGKKMRNHAQMITLMGVILAVSVIMISSLAAEIANIDFVVSTQSSASIPTEFNNVKDTFGLSLNYNLADIGIDTNNESVLNGAIDDIYKAFNQTRDDYFDILFRHDILFDAYLKRFWSAGTYPVQGYNTFLYRCVVTLYLDDGNSNITEDAVYLIAYVPEI